MVSKTNLIREILETVFAFGDLPKDLRIKDAEAQLQQYIDDVVERVIGEDEVTGAHFLSENPPYIVGAEERNQFRANQRARYARIRKGKNDE